MSNNFGIDLSAVKAEDKEKVQTLLAQLHQKKLYNTELAEFFANVYPWQEQYIRFTKDNSIVGAIAANRTGKTHTTMAMVACHLMGFYPDGYEGRKFDKPVKVLVAAVDSNMCKDPLQEKLLGTPNKKVKSELGTGMIPRDFIDFDTITSDRGDDVKSVMIKHSSGGYSSLSFKGYSTGREALQGFTADIIAVDEQPPDDFFSEAVTRTATTGGLVLCSFTPLNGRTGLVEEFLSLKNHPNSEVDKFGAKWKESEDWAVVRAGWNDVKHIEEKAQKLLKKAYAPYERDARMYGVPMVGVGRIYQADTREIQYEPSRVNIVQSWNHLIGLDLGYGADRDPTALVMAAWNEQTDKIYITDDWVGNTAHHRDVARAIWGIDPKVPVAWPRDANDAKFGFKGGESLVNMFREDFDLNMLPQPFMNPVGADGKKNNHLRPGFAEIGSRMLDGRLVISSNCVDLLSEIDGYSWNDKGKTAGADHLCDAMRYCIMTIIQGYGEPIKSEDNWWDQHDDHSTTTIQSY